MSKTLILGCLLMTGFSVVAAQTRVHPQANAQLGALRHPQSSDPYRTLFTPVAQATLAPKEQNRTVRCGMTIIEADPMLDSKMAAGRPKDGTKYTIRTVPPPVCGAPR
jgi:hypothetical protein